MKQGIASIYVQELALKQVKLLYSQLLTSREKIFCGDCQYSRILGSNAPCWCVFFLSAFVAVQNDAVSLFTNYFIQLVLDSCLR
jgi:hypothetical protein